MAATRSLLPCLLLALVAAPLASAQVPTPLGATSLDLTVLPVGTPVPVDDGLLAVPLEVRYMYTPILPTFEATRVTVSVLEAPPWLVATPSPATFHLPVASLAYPYQATVTGAGFLLLSATADAPAFQTATVRLLGVADANGPYEGSWVGYDMPVHADFAPLTDVALPVRAVAAAPGERAAVPVQVTNHGNGAIRVGWELLAAPRGVDVTLPETLTLGSRQAGDAQISAATQLLLRIRTQAEEGDVVLAARTAYARDASVLGDQVNVTLHVTPADGAGDVVSQSLGLTGSQGLALQMGLAMAGLAGSVLWARHRRLRP